MNLDVFYNFAVVAESYTISDAARKLNIAQPALSTQIKNLEFYYGVQLIKTRQGSRHIELTTAGSLLYKRIKHILIEAEAIRMDVKRAGKREDVTVNIGTTVELIAEMGNYLERFEEWRLEEKEEEPLTGLRYNIVVDNQNVLAEKLDNEKISCMIVPYAPTQAYLYENRGTLSRGVYIVGKQDHPLLKDKTFVRLSTLKNVPLCVTSEIEPTIISACREEGVDIPIQFTSTAPVVVVDAAFRKGSLAVIGGGLPSWGAKNIVAVPLHSKYIAVEHYVYTKKNARNADITSKFLEFITEKMKK